MASVVYALYAFTSGPHAKTERGRMHDFLAGVTTAGCWAVGLLFLRLWRDSGDRLFVMFALAFWVLSLNWLSLAIMSPGPESRHVFYVIRLVAFSLLIVAIVDKNRPRSS